MKSPSGRALTAGGLALAAICLAIAGVSWQRAPSVPAEATSAGLSASGFRLASASIDLPADEVRFPGGAEADLIDANCTACHSADMALTQPALSADQWKATVTKMREIYHAPVAEQDVPAIVAYLAAMPGQKVAPATGKAQDPDPKVAPDISRRTG